MGDILADMSCPNISGYFYRKGENFGDIYNGPFSKGSEKQDYGTHERQTTCADIIFNASKSNAMYSGTKLQVPSLQLLSCIRC